MTFMAMMKSAQRILLVAGIGFCVLMTSCSSILFSTPSAPPSGWLAQWLTNPTCSPACFGNIVPGKTLIDEIPMILPKSNEAGPGIKIDPVVGPGPLSEMRQMTWVFDSSSDNGGVQTDEGGNVVSKIFINIYQTVTVGEVVAKYGPPTHVMLYYCRNDWSSPNCEVHLVYKNQGMALEIDPKNLDKNKYQVNISSDLKVRAIFFFPDDGDGYVKTIGQHSFNYPQYFFNWNGYSTYP
jgi:hypothetical protein